MNLVSVVVKKGLVDASSFVMFDLISELVNGHCV